jgi:hypothetical protein
MEKMELGWKMERISGNVKMGSEDFALKKEWFLKRKVNNVLTNHQ